MSTHIFSIAESIRAGWALTKKHFLLLLGSFVIMVVIQATPQGIMQIFFSGYSPDDFQSVFAKLPLIIILGLLFFVINLMFRVGFTKMTIKLVRHEGAGFKDLFTHNKYLVNFFVAALLYGLVVFLSMIPLILIAALFGAGFFLMLTKSDDLFSLIYVLVAIAGVILAVIPAVYFSIKYKYFSYFVVDHNLSPLEALQKSAAATRGIKLKLFFLFLALGLLNLLGAIALGIGLLATIPTGILANVYVYNIISRRTK